MALTLVATAGSASANSYATLAEGNAYHEAHVYASVWNDATDASKEQALVMATRVLDRMYEWTGYTATETQRLLWPRTCIVYPSGWPVPSTVIPDQLKDAVIEFARQLIVADRTADSEIETQGITDLKAGPVSLSFKDTVTAKVIPDAVQYLIPCDWGFVRGAGIAQVELMR